MAGVAEKEFKAVVRSLHRQGIYPGPAAIKRALMQGGKINNLNGRQSKWRREEMKELGIPLQRPNSVNMMSDMYDNTYGDWG